MSQLAFLFPGQGSQYVGMGKVFYENFKVAREVFEEAADSIEIDVKTLCFEGPEESLKLTENTQPTILTVSVAIQRAFYSETGLLPKMGAGHSLGEYSALVAADGLDFSDAVRVVKLRGKYMQEAVPPGVGGMVAVLGGDKKTVEDACISASNGEVVSPANFNAPGQIVISGHLSAIERALEILKEKEITKVVPLPVSAPFHSSLMKEAAQKLERELEKIRFRDLKFPIVTNVEAKIVHDAEHTRSSLVSQMSSPVKWDDSIEVMIEEGIQEMLELGPGKVLTGLMKRINKNI
ncbi:MAG: ACP S-malonyltransferase, partial [Thermodesulfobacteriota bacterium]|nr:ACP S-malonyltransferase [Thermodesulfobacteriota bacterium]